MLTEKEKSMIKWVQENKIHGDITEVVRLTGYTRTHVCKCLNQDAPSFNQEIVKTAIELIHKRQKHKAQLEKIINQ